MFLKSLIQLPLLLFIYQFSIGQTREIDDFSLKDSKSNKMISLSDYSSTKGIVVIFWSNKCPYATYYEERIRNLYQKFHSKGIQFLLINANFSQSRNSETKEGMVKKAISAGFNFPYLIDEKQFVFSSFGARKNPHAYILKPVNKKFLLIYNGAIDDNPQVAKDVSYNYLGTVILALLNGQPMKKSFNQPFGCIVKHH